MTAKDSDNEESPQKKAKIFCCQTFRKEIKGSDALKSLKKFISAVKSSDDVVLEYLKVGGSLSEILSLIDITAKGDLTTALPVFEAANLILLKNGPGYQQDFLEGARIILQVHIPTIKAMLSMNVAKQKKVALKLLTSIITLSSSFATEILTTIIFSPTMITDFIKHTSDRESVRKYFILFVLSFLIDGNTSNIKNLLEKKGFVSSIIPGLKFDEATTVNMTLSVLEDKILKNVKIHKTLKLKLFNTQNIKYLFDLYNWKGPQSTKELIPKKKNHKIKEVVVNPKEKELVVDSVHSFLLLLCCSRKYGVAFIDKSIGTSEELNNQLLLTVFESVADPLKNKKMAEVIMKTIAMCPDLMKPVLLKLEPSFQPRDSKNWFDAIEFAEDLIKTMNVSSMLQNETEEVISSHSFIGKVAKSLCAPFVLLRISKAGTEKSQPIEIQLCSLKLLMTMWDEMERLMSTFPKFERNLRMPLITYIFKHLPEGNDLVKLWHNLCDNDYISGSAMIVKKRSLFLSVVVSALQVVVECQGEEVNSLSLAADMLKHVDTIKESVKEEEFDQIQRRIVQFVEMDLISLTPDMDLFEKSLFILLRSTNNDSISRGSRILANVNIFKKNKSEVDVWLMCYVGLSSEHRIVVLENLIESLKRFFIKQSDDLENADITKDSDAMEIDDQPVEEDSLTPLVFESLKTLQSKSLEKKKFDIFRQYLNSVILHLQLFHNVDLFLYEQLKPHKKLLNKSTMEYLKSWQNSCTTDLNVFTCTLERDLIHWLLGEDLRKIQDVVLEKQNILKLYCLFRIVLAYLTQKYVYENLKFEEIPKYVEAFEFFVKLGPIKEVESGMVSCNLTLGGLSSICLNFLFANKHLLKAFNVFNKKNEVSYYTTLVVIKTLMKIRIADAKKILIEPWKLKFLKQIKSKLLKNKGIEDIEDLLTVLNFFEYEHVDAKEFIDLLTASDISLFVYENKLSLWTSILVKFVKLLCLQESLAEEVVKKLCQIMKHFISQNDVDVQALDECFVYLYKAHPRHLMMTDNGFLDLILQRSNITSTTEHLVKLLLNDPKKVEHFVKNAAKNLEKSKNPQILLSSLSVLLILEEGFLESIKPKNGCLVWKNSELQQKNLKKFLDVLELIYKKFEQQIVQSIKGETENFILENLNVCLQLVELFIDKKTITKYKKEMRKGNFHPKLMFEAVKKINIEEVTVNYLRGLLVILSETIKNSKDFTEELWCEYCSLISGVIELNKEGSWKDVADSSEWKEFSKLALGHCFGFKNPFLLKILRLLVSTIHRPEDEALNLFFQMLISHSQFLNVILSKSVLKNELVQLFYSLTEKGCSEKSAKHVPILLAAYNASLSSSDVALLKILRIYEKCGVNVSDYEPFVWGETAVSHYSVGGKPGLSLWQRFNMANVLDLLDTQRMELSLKEFPIYRNLELSQTLECENNIYDPAFLLPLFVNLLSPGSLVFCLPFIYKGGLGYTVRALSSQCSDVRTVASIVLNRFYNHLEMNHNLKQKLVWMHFINCFRYAIEDISNNSIPGVTSLFFAKMTLELSKQPTEMFKPLQNFLLAKPYIGFDTIPEFLPFFHSSEVSHWKLRQWLLEVLRDGTKTTTDLNVIYHSMALKVIFCFFHSPICDNDTRKLILQVMEKLVQVDNCLLLITEYGFLNWVSSISSGSYQFVLVELLQLLSVTSAAIIKDIMFQKSKYAHLSHLIQILNIAMRLLPVLSSVKSVELFWVYTKLVVNCFNLFLNEKRDWFRLNKRKLQEVVETGVAVLGVDCGKYTQVSFFFRDFEGSNEINKDFKKLVFLFNLLAN